MNSFDIPDDPLHITGTLKERPRRLLDEKKTLESDSCSPVFDPALGRELGPNGAQTEGRARHVEKTSKCSPDYRRTIWPPKGLVE
jgi:hypothetical protein